MKSTQKNKKANPEAHELDKDVAKLTTNTGSSRPKKGNEPPLAGQASG